MRADAVEDDVLVRSQPVELDSLVAPEESPLHVDEQRARSRRERARARGTTLNEAMLRAGSNPSWGSPWSMVPRNSELYLSGLAPARRDCPEAA